MYVRFQSSSVVTSSTLSERTLMLLTTPGFSPPWTNEASPSAAAAATSTCRMASLLHARPAGTWIDRRRFYETWRSRREGCSGGRLRAGAPRVRRDLPLPLRLQEGPLLELIVGLPELLLRVHDDRPVPGDGLLERLPRHQEEPDPLVAGLHRDLIAAGEEHQRAVLRLRGEGGVGPADSLGRDRQRPGGVAELPRSREDVREGV